MMSGCCLIKVDPRTREGSRGIRWGGRDGKRYSVWTAVRIVHIFRIVQSTLRHMTAEIRGDRNVWVRLLISIVLGRTILAITFITSFEQSRMFLKVKGSHVNMAPIQNF